ncbi:MAG TPA: trypsin-like serine protease [Myxococcales bacterium]|nr:trypsin-like serine protease [Myxococcales bacterium]
MRRGLLVAGAIAIAAGCAGPPPAGTCSLVQEPQPIFGGSGDASYLRASAEEMDAVALVRFATPAGETVQCTAFLVHPRWAVTAAHCAVLPAGSQGELSAGTSVFPVLQVVAHPSYDVALLELSTDAAGIRPIALSSRDPAPLVSARAQIAGFGLNDSGVHGIRQFAVVRISDAGGAELLTRSLSGSGACEGDSGGPLLTRDERGAVVALGSLSRGSAACNQGDRFVRADLWRDWALSVTGGPPPVEPVPCGSFDAAGQCFGDTAVWCGDGGALSGERCGAGTGTSCGWSDSSNGYRCVLDDPCGGADALGACDGPALTQCLEGIRRTVDCGSCGQTCAEGSADGIARCQAAGG